MSSSTALRWQPRRIVIRTGLAVLIGLTTWAVASVSAWMVPVYLAVMVLIFVTPQKEHRFGVFSTASVQLVGNDEHSQDPIPSTASTGDAELLNLTDQPVSGSAAAEPTVEPISSAFDSKNAAPVKQWRGRTRARKTAKSAGEGVAATPAPAWIRVGPGKFVRADSAIEPIVEGQPCTQPDLCVPSVDPLADLSTTPPTLSMATAATAPEPQNGYPPHTTESTPLEVIASHEDAPEPVAEEHGIAPSAFDPVLTISELADRRDDEVSDPSLEPTADSISAALGGETASDRDPDFERPRSRGEWPRSHVRRVLRGFTTAISGNLRLSRQRKGKNGCKPRTSVWPVVGPDRPVQQAAHRATGRVTHRPRALRPRSPPYRGVAVRSKDQHGIAVTEESVAATDGFSIGSPD